jgi:carbon-monoxide dehydrogenase medium subunit
MVRVCTQRALQSIRERTEEAGMPKKPILLSARRDGAGDGGSPPPPPANTGAIETTINGKAWTFKSGHDKTLLRLLREEAGLIGTKEGCAEGECGACTVFLDGQAVMACLVPAPRAHGAEIVTIEGLAAFDSGGLQQGSQEQAPALQKLHPIQEAFIRDGAVQCGYCTPGFLMSGAMLLEEKHNPSRDEIEQAITGNLCRCTGYYKIVQAIEDAARANA